MAKSIVGIIGGSGVYDLPGLRNARIERISKPWGDPSDEFIFGEIGETKAVFLPRHGRGHRLSPSGINYRANIDAMKRARVTDIISVSACSSFRAQYYLGMFVLVDQFIDRTQGAKTHSSETAALRMSPWRIPLLHVSWTELLGRQRQRKLISRWVELTSAWRATIFHLCRVNELQGQRT